MPIGLVQRATILAVLVILAACNGGDGGASPSPAASPADSPEASPVATATAEETTAATAAPEPEPEPVALEVDSLAEVIVSDLVVRSEPSVEGNSTIYENHLTDGDRLYVVAGPTAASGYNWYQVQPIQREGGTVDEELPFGWVAAASRGGEPWLQPLDFQCPGMPPSVDLIAGLAPEERLHCFRDQGIGFAAEWQGCGIQDPATLEPGWFENPACTVGPAGTFFAVRLPPGVNPPQSGGRVQVAGQFDDPRAQECRWINENPDIPEPPAEQVIFRCRTEYVATAVTPGQ